MKDLSQEERRIRQYLLGTLDAEQRELLEERFLTDADLMEEFVMIENEVVSDYLADTLTAQEKEQFQSHFLAVPGRLQKLEFFAALRKNIADQPRPISLNHLPASWKRFLPDFLRGEAPLLRYAFAAAALVLVLGGVWGLFRNWRAARPDGGYARLAVHTVTLSPVRGRDVGGGEISRIHLSEGIGTVRLQLPLIESNYQSYRAALLTDEGVEKFKWDGLSVQTAAGGKVLDIDVPAEILTRGDYRLRLDGRAPGGDFETLDSYSFRVIRD